MGSLILAACFLVYEDADLRQNVDGEAARGWPYPAGLQHPEGVYPSPGAPSLWCWCTQVQPMGEVHGQDALEVEEEAYASSPEEASQDASTLQVNHIPSKSSAMPHEGLAACCVCKPILDICNQLASVGSE